MEDPNLGYEYSIMPCTQVRPHFAKKKILPQRWLAEKKIHKNRQ
jgi:hypothetical protein